VQLESVYQFLGGFVFVVALDGQALGCIDKGSQVFTLSCNAGNDVRIKNNWPQLLDGGVRITFLDPSQIPTTGVIPSTIWSGPGVQSFANLNPAGISVPAEGGASGSSLFPFPKGVPANALEPPSISDLTPAELGEGGYEGAAGSFTTLDSDDQEGSGYYP
jgi:hypothetical protein